MILGVMLRCHERADTLRVVLDELFRYEKDLGIEVKVHVLADRLSFLAEEVLKDYQGRLYGLKFLPFPILSAAGERFPEACQFQYKALTLCHPDWILFQDDDRWFESNGADKELPDALNDENIDMWYADSWFVWDTSDQFNANRHHSSPVLFRFKPGNAFVLDRVLQAPLPLHDDAIIRGRTGTLKVPLLDYGTYSEDERVRVYQAFREAGKADPYIESIKDPPKLASISETLMRPWKDLCPHAS